MNFETIVFEQIQNVGVITLNRPDKLNALNALLMRELTKLLEECEARPSLKVVLITGAKKAFAAGADIKEMADLSFPQTYGEDFLTLWDHVSRFRKPLIAAVSGYALGGGCELLMMCDIVIAAHTAQFGQPEIQLGVIPGIGGTQRLTRAVGKAKAMDLILTGRLMKAEEAERSGLVSRVVPEENLLEEALAVAHKVATFSLPALRMAKECVNQAFESSLREGVHFERRLFQSTFALEDQKEGMTAFLEKRPARFKDS